MRQEKIRLAKKRIADGSYDAGWIDDLVAKRALAEVRRTPPGPDETIRGGECCGCTAGSLWPALILGVAILGCVAVVLFELI